MNRILLISRVQLLLISALLIVVVAVACGTEDESLVASGGEGGGTTQLIRMVESGQIFTEDDVKAVGWKAQKDLVLDYPGAPTFKWGYMN